MITKPKYSICLIMRNEEKVLGRCLDSLKEFRDRGGEVCVLDTGSTDNSVKIAKKYGCVVKEVGTKFRHKIKNYKEINKRFIEADEEPIVKEGDSYFSFYEARNECAEIASNDVIFWMDCDEVVVNMNIDVINELIEKGHTQFEYNFTFSFDQFGNEAIKFIQCKAYDRRVMQWRGIIHELVMPYTSIQPNRIYLNETIYKLSHYQNIETGRHSYAIGLAVDLFNNPDNDRHTHYAARELFWHNRSKSALKLFKKHIEMNGWHSERAESWLFIGDIYGQLNYPEKQVQAYVTSYHVDSQRNTAFIRLSQFYYYHKNYTAAVCYAKAALEIKHTGFYADNASNYREIPHEILYRSYGWLGDIESAKKHLLKALEYCPSHPEYLRDTQFYFEYPDNGIQGWMRFHELQWLYENAKGKKKIVEVGSWKGRSTHAILSGNKDAEVWAVDTWMGSDDENDLTNSMAKEEDVFVAFKNNLSKFKNLYIERTTSIEGAKIHSDNSLDMVFIDANHTYEEVKKDIEAWLPKVKIGGLICGHDYSETWGGVMQAVDETIGKIDGVCDSIWYKIKEEPTNIPKQIFTIWVSDNPVPKHLKQYVETHKINGYKHHLIDIENCHKNQYVNNCLEKKQWVKAADYLRLWYLYKYGGIYLDADVEVFKNFDELLNERMFLGIENFFEGGKIAICNAVIGSEKGHPFLNRLLSEMEKMEDADTYKAGMDLLNVVGVEYQQYFKLLPPEYFYPKEITTNTICKHHFTNSWVEKLPMVSIIIPQLGREDGLKKCLDSINNLNYPKELIETIIIEGDETVPEKVHKGLQQSNGEYICYAANDMTFEKESLITAVKASKEHNKALVSFNEGHLLPDNGNINTHFIIKKYFIQQLGGEIFDRRFYHVAVDNLLWSKAEKCGQAMWCEAAKITHNHFSKNSKFDEIYQKGWEKIEEDRNRLKQELAKL